MKKPAATAVRIAVHDLLRRRAAMAAPPNRLATRERKYVIAHRHGALVPSRASVDVLAY